MRSPRCGSMTFGTELLPLSKQVLVLIPTHLERASAGCSDGPTTRRKSGRSAGGRMNVPHSLTGHHPGLQGGRHCSSPSVGFAGSCDFARTYGNSWCFAALGNRTQIVPNAGKCYHCKHCERKSIHQRTLASEFVLGFIQHWVNSKDASVLQDSPTQTFVRPPLASWGLPGPLYCRPCVGRPFSDTETTIRLSWRAESGAVRACRLGGSPTIAE